MEGIQTWIGLPVEDEETGPRFDQVTAEELTAFDRDGVRYRLIVGSASGE